MSTHFTTSSGSHYEIDRDAIVGDRIRRVNRTAEKRADGAWIHLISHFPNPIEEGSSVFLELASLADYGRDDHGTPPEDTGPIITRTTTPITKVWEDNA